MFFGVRGPPRSPMSSPQRVREAVGCFWVGGVFELRPSNFPEPGSPHVARPAPLQQARDPGQAAQTSRRPPPHPQLPHGVRMQPMLPGVTIPGWATQHSWGARGGPGQGRSTGLRNGAGLGWNRLFMGTCDLDKWLNSEPQFPSA